MNLVGHQGKGESIWLAFFLFDVLTGFSSVAEARGDGSFATVCREHAERLRSNVETHGWDGDWYRRAYFDDGLPLGSSTNAECRIDSLPQSWAVLSRAGDPERRRRGLEAVDARLVRRDLRVVQLFDPAFDHSDLEPGYVKGYVPGVRENGGQYTHAAVWAAMAFAEEGDGERAWELFRMLNPVGHGDSRETIQIYKVEPYVLAADVYTNPMHAGRGGWTWYTGSAGWMYRLITESLLGIRLDHNRLSFKPLMPRTWDNFEIHYRHHQTTYSIRVSRPPGPPGARPGSGVTKLTCDGKERPGLDIALEDDGRVHPVEVEVG